MWRIFKYFILSLLFSNLAFGKTIKVAVVDTGLDLEDPRFKSVLCFDGHKDFTGKGLLDTYGHGTHVAGLIKQYAADSDYCLLILKYYDIASTSEQNIMRELQAFEYAINQEADFINFSSGGPSRETGEKTMIENSPNVTFIVAAGNEKVHICKKEQYYPACYKTKNIIVVGNHNKNGIVAANSNYGDIDAWEVGVDVYSTLPDNSKLIDKYNNYGYLSGTSMATAIHTGKMVYDRTH